MKNYSARRVLGWPGLMLALACTEAATAMSFPVSARVVDDRGDPVGGAVLEGSGVRATSDPHGRLAFTVVGRPGMSLPIRVSCPRTHSGEATPEPLGLRLLYGVDGETAVKPLEYRAQCLRKTRAIVLAIQARAGLDVSVNGQKSGTVSADGAFHKAFDLAPQSELEVKLDTTLAPGLRPQNPTRSFRITDDDVLVFAQTFQEERPPAKASRARSVPARHIPQRL